MTSPEFEVGPHLSLGELARLAGGVTRGERDRSLDHVIRCRRCAGALAELTVQATDPIAGSSQEVPGEWLQRAHELPLVADVSRTRERFRLRREWWMVPAAAVMALLIALFVFRIGAPKSSSGWPVASTEEQVRVARLLQMDSVGQLLYWENLPAVESGNRGSEARESQDAEVLTGRYKSNPSAESAWWAIAAQIQRRNMSEARHLLDEAHRAFPNDARLANLEAIWLFQSKQLSAAEIQLNEASNEHSCPTVIANLAILLHLEGKDSLAVQQLRTLEARWPESEAIGSARAILGP